MSFGKQYRCCQLPVLLATRRRGNSARNNSPFSLPISPPPSSPVRVRDEYGHAAGFAAPNRGCLRFVGYFVSASMSQIRPKLANSRLLAHTKYSVSYRQNDSCIAAKMLANSRQSSRLNQQRSKSQQSIAARDRRQMLTDIT